MTCGPFNVCGRIGGDEFVVIGRGEDFAETFTKRFNAEIERKNNTGSKPYRLSASVGYITKTPKESDTLLQFIKEADEKMYLVKKTRKNHRASHPENL